MSTTTATKRTVTCSCAHHNDGSTTTMLCPSHADTDPCLTMARVTGRRRRGSVVKGRCTACGWSSDDAARRASMLRHPSSQPAKEEATDAGASSNADALIVEQMACDFNYCNGAAVGRVDHDIVKPVPICQQCADRFGWALLPLTVGAEE